MSRASRTSLAVVLSVLALGACGPVEYGVVVDGRRLPVIDMHLHPGEWQGVPSATAAFLAERFPFPFNTDPETLANGILSAGGIADQLDDAGASIGLLYAVYAPRTVGVAPNGLVADYLAEKPDRFYGLASIRVDNWRNDRDEQLAALQTALEIPGMVGIKLAHAHMHFRMDDPDYYGIYELAGQMQKPVYLHTGTSPFPGTSTDAAYTDPAYLEEAIVAYPDTTFILGHLGFDFIEREHAGLETCIELAQTYPNVYLEPSALGSKGSDPEGDKLTLAMQRMKEGGVVDRIIYGSDGPQSPGFLRDYLERSVSAMQRADYSVDEIEMVLAGNFAKVFGVEVPQL